jgi:hypothetical protein
MADYAISNVPRRVVYAPSGVGPYAFTFEILDQTDIAVYKGSTLLTLTTDYTVTINLNGTGSVTLVATAGSDNITIVGAKNIQRTSDFTTGGDLFADTLNDELDNQTIFIQQVAETAERGLKAPVVDPTDINMTLPSKTARAGTFLAFDSPSGNPIAGPEIASVGTVTQNIANINTVAADIANVNTTATNITNVNTVAGISANVTTVAGISANVTSVAGNSSNINTVAGSISNVNTTATNIASVNTVASEIGAGQDVTVVAADLTGADNIGIVAGSITDINALGPIAADIATVAGIDSDVTAVAADATDIGTVAGNITNVNTVAGVSGNVTTVAGISANVTTVAGISSNVTTVAGISANVTTVAGISANVTSVAGNATNINAVATDITNVNAVGTNITNVNTVATNIADVNTVASALATPLSAASAVSYDNSASGLTATDVQDAIDELEDEKLSLTGGTMTGQLTVSVIQADYIYAKNLPSVGSFTWDAATTSPAASVSDVGARVITSIHSGMRRCVINDSGVVQYYLSATDSTKKADGTNSNLTGADGQVMVEIPKFYTRREVNGTQIVWSVSAIPLTGFTIHPAFIKNGVEVNYRYYSAYDACFEIDRNITAVADAGGGNITITSTGHALYAGDVITIAGTTSYNGTFTVVTRTDANNFTVTATFVATETGTFKAYLSGLNFDNNATAGRSIGTTSATKLASISGIFPAVGITRGEFRTIAANRGTGWRQLDWTLFSAIQLLYLIEYQTFFSQNVLGNGNTATTYATTATDPTQAGNGGSVAGKSDSLGNASTDTTSGASSASRAVAYMSYRGIENFYGNEWNWADGVIVNPDGTVSANQGDWWFTNNSADFSDSVRTNMTQIMSNAPTGSGFASAIAGVDNFFIATSTSGGSSTTYLTDQYFGSTAADRVVVVGGDAAFGASAGAFFVAANDASSFRVRRFGARLAF